MSLINDNIKATGKTVLIGYANRRFWPGNARKAPRSGSFALPPAASPDRALPKIGINWNRPV
jgi:hypothetical protein